jgi:hypothetical protein
VKRGAIILGILISLQLDIAQAGVLNVRQIYQLQSAWCWAATCQSVLEFYGLVQAQTNVAHYGTGGINTWTYLGGSGTGPDGIYRRGCDMILNNFGSLATTGVMSYITAPQLLNEITAARPVIVNWVWDTSGGHILIAHGMVSNNVFLMDPLYGPTISDYNWVRSGGGHTWQWTLKLVTSSQATNGVPRWWLGSYGLTNNWDASAMADQDADHMETWEEYIADTNPTNPDSCFRTDQQMTPHREIVISWLSSSNRLYTLQFNTNTLCQPVWADVMGWVQVCGNGATLSFTNSSLMEVGCHRLWVMTPP